MHKEDIFFKIWSRQKAIYLSKIIDIIAANLSKQMKKADSQSFKFVMIVGQEEQKNLKFKLKDLELNKSFELSEKELLEYFSGWSNFKFY